MHYELRIKIQPVFTLETYEKKLSEYHKTKKMFLLKNTTLIKNLIEYK